MNSITERRLDCEHAKPMIIYRRLWRSGERRCFHHRIAPHQDKSDARFGEYLFLSARHTLSAFRPFLCVALQGFQNIINLFRNTSALLCVGDSTVKLPHSHEFGDADVVAACH